MKKFNKATRPAAMLKVLIVLSAAAAASAFTSPAPSVLSCHFRQGLAASRKTPTLRHGDRQGGGCLMTRMAIEEVEYVKIFGRLGEKMLMGDASAVGISP